MAFTKQLTVFCFVFLLATTMRSCPTNAEAPTCPFEEIYQFGDSMADTGNLIREGPAGQSSYAAHLPYGQDTFHKPTGRCSNGLLMIDYIAKALKLPLLNPYLQKNAPFDHGVNFAVAGSTALDSEFFTARNVRGPSTNVPLSAQLEWFKSHLDSTCGTQCEGKLRRALIMMGEVGGNDYNYGFFQGKSIEEMRTWVPYVVGAIVNATREVIRLGATRIVVPGNFPIGCFPIYLTSFPSWYPWGYDDKGCLSEHNKFATFHNDYLQKALSALRKEFPEVVIVYGDYYTAFQSILRNSLLGYDPWTLLKACCGEGGLYNYNFMRMCGTAGVPVCNNPDQHISWDGIHLTQETNLHMSEFLISSILSQIKCVW